MTLFILLEEAHHFAPASGETISGVKPVLGQVRPPYTPHVAPDISAPQVWREYGGK